MKYSFNEIVAQALKDRDTLNAGTKYDKHAFYADIDANRIEVIVHPQNAHGSQIAIGRYVYREIHGLIERFRINHL
jgi:hypothetical protein